MTLSELLACSRSQGVPLAKRAGRCLLCPQVVGNLLYYRFLNPAVVAPDAFDIVAMAAGGALAAPQRHTLGAVAQLLQHAAAGKTFAGESRHLQVLNDYLEETHFKFRCRVPAPSSSPSPFSPLLIFRVPLPLSGILAGGESVGRTPPWRERGLTIEGSGLGGNWERGRQDRGWELRLERQSWLDQSLERARGRRGC